MIKVLLNNWSSYISWKKKKLLRHKNKNIQKLMQSFQHNILHPIRSWCCTKPIRGASYSCVRGFGHLVNLGKLLMWRNTPEVIHSLQLHISYQTRSYSSAKIIWRLSYTCFWGTGALGQFWGKGPNTPQSRTESHKEKIKGFNSLFHIKWDLTLVSMPSVGRIAPVSQLLRYWGNNGKLGPNIPNHVQGHMKNNPKSSAPRFTSN